MCGIAGILTLNSSYQDSLERITQRMQRALYHRGPDDAGIYLSPQRQTALAHTRLSILDLSTAGHQPMSTSDGRYWITFNGEVYNFQELRQNLIAGGEEFYSQTDTEVILKLYRKMGKDCVQHLRGMFAFAIWDEWEQTCFLARDPLGIKPLYYWRSGSTLVFASELRAVMASGLPSKNMSMEGLYGYLMAGSVPEPNTLVEDVYCLDAGHWLFWQSDKLLQQQYWEIDFTPEKISPQEAQQKVREALVDSIQHHFVSDVPVGIFLSGGIDSTTVLALASQLRQEQLCTYSIAFEEEKWNEGGIAEQVAKQFGAKHTEFKVTAANATELLPKFLESIDQPSIDGFNTFCVSQITRQGGTKVVLSGLGGDELFGGYQSFLKVPQMVAWGKQLQALPLVSSTIGMGLANWGNSPKMKRLGDFLHQEPSTTAAYRSFRGIFAHHEASYIAKKYLSDRPLPNHNSVNPYLRGQIYTAEDQVSLLELSCYMRNQLLRDSDVMSMRWGLELRVPLVDSHLLQAIASIPSHMRLAFGKQLLIQAVPELPEIVFKRPKRGFYFPFEEWMANEWQDYFGNVSSFKNIPLKPWYRRWSLSILNHWWEQLTA
jgi:asparagine synthase (glutamine-hydrolysing)